MFLKLLHSIAAQPFVYNQIQIFFGSHKRKQVIKENLLELPDGLVVLDLGGGTGFYRDLLGRNIIYICLDNDLIKLNGMKAKKNLKDFPLLADASRIPLKDLSVDVIVCNSMSHHITEAVLENLLSESSRVLKTTGKFLFLDAVYRSESFLNRLLWKLDRGEHPHTKAKLMSMINNYFTVISFKEFYHFYDYVFFAGRVK